MAFNFQRYLAAKKTIDDRALNRRVWGRLSRQVTDLDLDRPLRVLEIGAGIGTMLERILDWGLTDDVDYTGIDSDTENIQTAYRRLSAWAYERGYNATQTNGELVLTNDATRATARFQVADVFEFAQDDRIKGKFDLLIAQAFFDLVDIARALPSLMRCLAPGGLFYFTLNFDGVTIFEPELDPALDAKIMALYHQSMDERVVDGTPSGDSRTGRHLFFPLMEIGEVLAVGASDWVVYPQSNGYPDDEAYFLDCILHFIEETLRQHPTLDGDEFEAWLAERRQQVKRGELIYIAHQLDLLGVLLQNGHLALR